MYYLTDDLTVVFDDTQKTSGVVLGDRKSDVIERLVSISVNLLTQRGRVLELLKQSGIPLNIKSQLVGQTNDMLRKLNTLDNEIEKHNEA